MYIDLREKKKLNTWLGSSVLTGQGQQKRALTVLTLKIRHGRWHGRLWRFWLRSRVAGRSDGERQSDLSK